MPPPTRSSGCRGRIEESGPGSGIYETTDGGARWTRLGGGLPTGAIGRIGLALYPREPGILYALVENANPRPPDRRRAQADRADAGGERRRGRSAARSTGPTTAGATWRKRNPDDVSIGGKAMY